MQAHLDPIFRNLSPPVRIRYCTAPPSAPASINSTVSSIQTAAACLPVVQQYLHRDGTESIQGIIICCFSAHPLVPILREITTKPVVGIMEAGLLLGSQLGGTLGIVTTDKRWEPLLRHEIHGLGLSNKCTAGVISSGLTVLELETLPKDKVEEALVKSAKRMVEERESDVILLGCAGMVGLDKAIQREVGEDVTVLDPVRCGVELCLSLARMKVKTAKRGLYEQAEA